MAHRPLRSWLIPARPPHCPEGAQPVDRQPARHAARAFTWVRSRADSSVSALRNSSRLSTVSSPGLADQRGTDGGDKLIRRLRAGVGHHAVFLAGQNENQDGEYRRAERDVSEKREGTVRWMVHGRSWAGSMARSCGKSDENPSERNEGGHRNPYCDPMSTPDTLGNAILPAIHQVPGRKTRMAFWLRCGPSRKGIVDE